MIKYCSRLLSQPQFIFIASYCLHFKAIISKIPQTTLINAYASFFLYYLSTGTYAGSHEKRLLHHLLDSYNVLERPVQNESDPLQLSFGLTLMQIIDVVSNLMEF